MTGLPPGGFAVLGDPKGGGLNKISKALRAFCFLSSSAFERARRALLKKQNLRFTEALPILLVGMTGFEPATPTSRT
jgi:hypothetical protein